LIRPVRLLVLLLVLVVAAGGIATSGPIHDSRGTQTHDCGDGDSITYSGPTSIWPPNHKYRDLSITATEGSDLDPMDEVSLGTAGHHDEVTESGEEMNGAGHTPLASDVSPAMAMDQGTGSATTNHRIRGERSGRGDGRTYTFDAMATFDNGSTRHGSLT
jgi:hypothetical protein